MSTLLDGNLQPVDFDGATYSRERDQERLTGQKERVFEAMKDGAWRTLDEIHDRIQASTGKRDPEASISARLRDLRKPRFGAHTVERRHRGDAERGLYEYRLVVSA